jgi:hypothetical protein
MKSYEGVGSGLKEAGPILEVLRNRLLNSVVSAETSAGSASPGGARDRDKQEVAEIQMTKKPSTGAATEVGLPHSIGKVLEVSGTSWDLGTTELAKSVESLEQMQQSASAVLGPVRNLCDHIRKLPNGFAPLRVFEQQLGLLSESFPPMKALHEQIALIADHSSAPFSQLAKSLKVMHETRERLVRLASTFETASEIETEFNKFAQTFTSPSPRKSTIPDEVA